MLLCLGVQLLSVAASMAAGLPGGKRPNFIHLMMDDWGWGDVGVYSQPGGGYTHVKTPNIDSLAKGGKLFTGQYKGGIPFSEHYANPGFTLAL